MLVSSWRWFAGQLPNRSLAFHKKLQHAHSPDLELEKNEVPEGEKKQKSEKSKSLSHISGFIIRFSIGNQKSESPKVLKV